MNYSSLVSFILIFHFPDCLVGTASEDFSVLLILSIFEHLFTLWSKKMLQDVFFSCSSPGISLSLGSHGSFSFSFFFILFWNQDLGVCCLQMAWTVLNIGLFAFFLQYFCCKCKTVLQKVREREKPVILLPPPPSSIKLHFCSSLSMFSYAFNCIPTIWMIFVSYIFTYMLSFFHLPT